MENTQARLVLIVEDDPNTAELVATYLQREGFRTRIAGDGERALEIAGKEQLVFVVLDIMLPRIDGWEVCRRLRTFSDVPILMLTAREEEIDRVAGLTLGADDYVVKPFSPRELVARVQAILRRSGQLHKEDKEQVGAGELLADLAKCRVFLKGKALSLTGSEYKILTTMMARPGHVFSRSALLDSLYEHGEVVVERVVDVHIGNIRQKIENTPSSPQYILTVRGFGYTFTDELP